MAINNGGPAFPVLCDYVDGKPRGMQTQNRGGWHEGMSLRDYFAVTAPAPEPSDICELMGWEKDIPIGGPHELEDGDDWRDSVYSRWSELPSRTRQAAHAKFAYQFADAMLAAREQTTTGKE